MNDTYGPIIGDLTTAPTRVLWFALLRLKNEGDVRFSESQLASLTQQLQDELSKRLGTKNWTMDNIGRVFYTK